MHRVIKEFTDLQDAKPTKAGIMYHNYRVGDIYRAKDIIRQMRGLQSWQDRTTGASNQLDFSGYKVIYVGSNSEITFVTAGIDHSGTVSFALDFVSV